MKSPTVRNGIALSCMMLIAACAHDPYANKQSRFTGFGNYRHFEPSLVQIARMRANSGVDDPFQTEYHITDRDVLDYTDHVKSLLSLKMNNNAAARYGSSIGQVLLSSLIALVPAFGWSASAGSVMGGGSGFPWNGTKYRRKGTRTSL